LKRENREYGNLILSRLPVLQSFSHLLPQPAEGGIKHMQRVAIEAVVQAPWGPLRVTTTHLEYFSARHRAAQIERLLEIQEEVAANESWPPLASRSPYDAVPRPGSSVLCGDFNVLPHDSEYDLLFYRPDLADAWKVVHGGKPHPLSTGLYDKVQWTTGPHCRDYFAVTPDLAKRAVAVEMDERTDASDHQPLRLVLAER
jgi:endonuclease/exonuclease/phosphatase family metal-dependent hydrolase